MRKIFPPGHEVEERNHHIEETKRIIEFLSKNYSFIILGPTGSGKSYLIDNVVIRYLDKRSQQFFGDNRKLYVKISFNNLGREELEIFYNSFFPQFTEAGFEVENFKNYTIDDIVEKICWGFKQITAIYKTAFYIVVDDFEFFTDSDIEKLMQFRKATAKLVLATNERRFPSKYSEWFDDFEKVVVLPITEEKQKKYFYDSLVIGKLNLTLPAYRMLYNRLKLMYFYPGAVKRCIENLKSLCGDKLIDTEDVREKLKLHRWGLKYRDLTIGLFLFVFVLFFMRFLFLRGPESYRYAVYAGLSVMGVWFYRLFARRLMRSEEDEFVALPEYSPEWYSKYSVYMSTLLHISGYFLVLFALLIVFDKKLELKMFVGLPFVFLPDIDIKYSFVSSYLSRFLRWLSPGLEFYIEDIDILYGHRGPVHSLLFVFIVSLVLFPVALISWWVWVSIVVALVSHLMIDALSPMGVPLFYPALHRWVTPFSFSKQIPVGSLREGSAAIVMSVICLILLPIVLTTPSGIYEKITKDPFTAIKKITQREKFLQYAVVEGFNLVTTQYIREKMRIIRSTGEELFVLGSDGVVYNTKNDINVYKIERQTTGQRIKYVTERYKVVEVTYFENIFKLIPDDGYVIGEFVMYSPIGEISLKTPSTMKIEPKKNVLFGTDGVKIVFTYANKNMLGWLLSFSPQVVRGELEIVRILEEGSSSG